MEERVGAYVAKEDGNIVPDAEDEAMAKRHGLRPKKTDTKKQTEDAKKEVKENAISE